MLPVTNLTKDGVQWIYFCFRPTVHDGGEGQECWTNANEKNKEDPVEEINNLHLNLSVVSESVVSILDDKISMKDNIIDIIMHPIKLCSGLT